MSNVSNNQASITLAIVKASYQIINEPTRVKLVAISKPNEWKNPRLKAGKRGDTYSHSFFINLKAVEARKVPSLIAAFYEANDVVGVELTPEEENKLTMPLEDFNFNVVKEVIVHKDKTAPNLPMKGDMVDCVIQYATDTKNEDGLARDKNNQRILEVGDFIAPKAKETTGVTWASFGQTAEAGVTAAEFVEGVARDSVIADSGDETFE